MITSLLFDLDGTLIDSREDLADAVNSALVTVGKPKQTTAQIVPHVGNGLNVLLERVMGPIPKDVLDQAVDAFSRFYAGHCVDKTVLYPGVKDLLDMWYGKVKMAVVTNKPLSFSVEILQKLGVIQYFESVVGGDSTPKKKPHPEPFQKALNDLAAKTLDTLMVGDGPQDISGAQSLGVKSCLALYGYGFHPETRKLKPDFEIDRFLKLKEIVL